MWGFTNSVGSALVNVYAIIVVNHPENVNLSCSNSSISASVTPSKTVCFVEAPAGGETQNCIVTISDQSHDPVSKTVENITAGQIIEITVGFEYYLFKSGEGEIVTWKAMSGTVTKSLDSLVCSKYSICTVDKVDFSEYSTICIDILPTNMSAGGYGYKFGVTLSPANSSASNFYSSTTGRVPDNAAQNNQYAIGTAPVINGTRATIEIPITDGAKGEYYLGFGCYAGGYTIYNVYLK